MTFDATTIAMLKTGIWETFYMVALSSFLAYLIGLPLGIILVVTDSDGIYPIPLLQKILGLVINLMRSVFDPFIHCASFVKNHYRDQDWIACDYYSSDDCSGTLCGACGGVFVSGD